MIVFVSFIYNGISKVATSFNLILVGPSGGGKSSLVADIINHKDTMFSTILDKIVYFYAMYQPLYDMMKDVKFIEGVPTQWREFLGQNTLLIIEHLMVECGGDKKLTWLFTRESHHLNISIIFITQNFFHKGKEMREVTLNAHYILLCKNRRDLSQVTHLFRQLFPGNSRVFQEVYEDDTKNHHSYLLIDLRSDTDENMRLLTNILSNQVQYVYQKR